MKFQFDLKLKIFLLLFIVIISFLIGMIINNLKKESASINRYESDNMSFYHDNNFEIKDEKDGVELRNYDGSGIIVIKKMDYTETAQKKDKDQLATSLSYQVIGDDANYIELYNGKDEERDNYYYLYENYEKERQIEVITIFTEKDIFVIIYQANSNEFDLYSESISLITDSIES